MGMNLFLGIFIFAACFAPTFPMTGLLVFWGGVQNGFWAFGHNPTAYAKKISCPTLVLFTEDRTFKYNLTNLNTSGQEIMKRIKLFKNEHS